MKMVSWGFQPWKWVALAFQAPPPPSFYTYGTPSKIPWQYFVIDLMHWRHKGSHLHNNDASLVSRSAHVLCWQCALALSLSVRGPGRASPAVWLAGFAPLAACLAMTHVAVFRLTPNAAGRPSVTSYAYGLFTLSENYCCKYWMNGHSKI